MLSTGCSKTKVLIKTFILTSSLLQFTVFEFIWIQYVCKFCLVYHLINLDASSQSYSSFSEMYVFFKRANSVEKLLLNFRNAFVSHCFRNSSLTIIWNNFGRSNYKCMKRNNSKRNYSVPYAKECHIALMHLWHLSTISLFWDEYFAERL